MKKVFICLILMTILKSCALKTIDYTYNFTTDYNGIDFTKQKGKWLFHSVNIPESEQKTILKKLNLWTKNQTTISPKMIDKNGKEITSLFNSALTSESIDFLKKTTNYKYLVYIHPLENKQSTVKVTKVDLLINVVDITTNQLILGEQITATMDNEHTLNIGSIKGIRATIEPNILKGLIKKGLKKIDQNSIY